ncbi:unnamed protein product [Boreogadus saida]
MGGPPEELRNGLLDDTRRQSSRTNSTRVVASTVPVLHHCPSTASTTASVTSPALPPPLSPTSSTASSTVSSTTSSTVF